MVQFVSDKLYYDDLLTDLEEKGLKLPGLALNLKNSDVELSRGLLSLISCPQGLLVFSTVSTLQCDCTLYCCKDLSSLLLLVPFYFVTLSSY